jgi:hypothetical protein
MNTILNQTAPFPELLANLIRNLKYKEGWEFNLIDLDRGQESKGLTLVITLTCTDSYTGNKYFRVNH